jgi:hypothetical protein
MTYQAVYSLGTDPSFRNRLNAALTTESSAKTDDPLADQAMRNPEATVNWFMPFVTAAPGFADQYASGGQAEIDDGELLSATQAAWPRVADLYASVLVPVVTP